MFATIVTFRPGQRAQVHQFEAPTVKDCLVAWAGKIVVEGMTDESRTRLRGDMADFNAPAIEGIGNVWRLESDLGLGSPAEASVVVVETVRR